MRRKQKRLVVPFIQKPNPGEYFPSVLWYRLAFLLSCYGIIGKMFPIVILVFLSPFNSFLLMGWNVQRGSAFRYPRLAKCLVTVERETSTPISFNLSAIDRAEIEGSRRMYCPTVRDSFVVIFLIPPLCFTSPVSCIFLRFRRTVLIGIFVKLCISIAFRIPCFQKCNMACRCVSCFDEGGHFDIQ